MIGINVQFQAKGASPVWPNLKAIPAPTCQVAVLEKGMESGKPAVAIRMTTVDGKDVIYQTSGALFVAAARLVWARHPELDVPEIENALLRLLGDEIEKAHYAETKEALRRIVAFVAPDVRQDN